MVIENDFMMYKNVVSHTYYLHYSKFNDALEDFNHKLVLAHCEINGPFFYALHNMPFDEHMLIDVYIPVVSPILPGTADLNFQSYFYIDNMLTTRVKGNFEIATEYSYEELLLHAAENNYELNSPIFHIFRDDGDRQWVDIKVKVVLAEDQQEEGE